MKSSAFFVVRVCPVSHKAAEIPFPFHFAVLEIHLQCQEFKGGRCNLETEGIFRHEKKQAEDTFLWREVSSFLKISQLQI